MSSLSSKQQGFCDINIFERDTHTHFANCTNNPANTEVRKMNKNSGDKKKLVNGIIFLQCSSKKKSKLFLNYLHWLYVNLVLGAEDEHDLTKSGF